jgi:DNA polymerase-4
VLACARALMAAARPLVEPRGLTLVGITVGNLEPETGQLTLPLDGSDRAALDAALDGVRDRFGTAAITRAALLGDSALEAWLLPGDAQHRSDA